VVDDKWLAAIDADVHGEMDRISQALTQRVKELAYRYEVPLPQLSSRISEIEGNVNGHLTRMGFEIAELAPASILGSSADTTTSADAAIELQTPIPSRRVVS
jgi:hypothetical protein